MVHAASGGGLVIPTPGRCLAMTVSAIALAGVLLMAGVSGAVLLALTPGLLCLSMAFVMGHGDPHGEELLRTASMATARQAELPVGRSRPVLTDPPRSMKPSDYHG
jgi:hypothetical protein